jgi:hypothetical protein
VLARRLHRTCIELVMNIVRYMMFFVFGMLLGLLLSALLPSLALWLGAELLIAITCQRELRH